MRTGRIPEAREPFSVAWNLSTNVCAACCLAAADFCARPALSSIEAPGGIGAANLISIAGPLAVVANALSTAGSSLSATNTGESGLAKSCEWNEPFSGDTRNCGG